MAFAKELRSQIAASDNDNVKALENIIFSASDETSIDSAITNYGSLSNAAKNVVTRIDTHTYSGSKREELRKTAEAAGENLWMSEVDGAYTAGTDAGEMTAALGLAQRIWNRLKGLKVFRMDSFGMRSICIQTARQRQHYGQTVKMILHL